MKRRLVIIILATMLLLLGVGSTAAEEAVAFQAQFGLAELVSSSCIDGVCTVEYEGSGAANIMGAVSGFVQLEQDSTTSPCYETVGYMTLVGSTGSITIEDIGNVCRTPGVPWFHYGDWVVIDGTGEFSGLEGSGTSRASFANGPTAHLSGTVSN